jgi:hypothetical protein
MHLHLTVPIEALKGYDYIIISAGPMLPLLGTGEVLSRPLDPELLEKILVAPKEKRITPAQVIEIWNGCAKNRGWSQVRVLSDDLKKKIQKATKLLPTPDHWHHTIQALSEDSFFSGSGSDYKTNILTLFYKERYAHFYNQYLATLEGDNKNQVELALEDWTKKLTQVGL